MSDVMTASNQPWYKQRWLLFVLSVPMASVILSSIMVYHAVTGRDSLVSDNYYKDGLDINQTIEQDQLAKRLAVRADITITDDGQVLLQLDSLAKEREPFLTLKLVHPTLGDRDETVTMLPAEDQYIGEVSANLYGNWYIDLYAHDESWRVRKLASMPLKNYVLAP